MAIKTKTIKNYIFEFQTSIGVKFVIKKGYTLEIIKLYETQNA